MKVQLVYNISHLAEKETELRGHHPYSYDSIQLEQGSGVCALKRNTAGDGNAVFSNES